MRKATILILAIASLSANGQQLNKRMMIWRGQVNNTTDYLTIEHGKGTTLNGWITGEANGKPVDISYTIVTDNDWNVQTLKVRQLFDPSISIELSRNIANQWHNDAGKHISQLDGCTEIDLSLSPSTNSLPILKFPSDVASMEITVAYVDLLAWAISPVKQRYSRSGINTYKYENLNSRFASTITFDNDGFVVSYPGVWERIYPPGVDNKQNEIFASALVASTFSDEIPLEDRIYDWIIGDWEVVAFDYLPDGSKIKTEGEWMFRTVLEGRAIQDVWIAPKRSMRTAQTPKTPNRYGTTLRVYYPAERTWKINWYNPISGATNELKASREGKDIVHKGVDGQGNLVRWVFTDIQSRSFQWYGEVSKDNGQSWWRAAEFFGNRRDQGIR